MVTLVYSTQQKAADGLYGEIYSINRETQHMKLKLAANSLHLQTSAHVHSASKSKFSNIPVPPVSYIHAQSTI